MSIARKLRSRIAKQMILHLVSQNHPDSQAFSDAEKKRRMTQKRSRREEVFLTIPHWQSYTGHARTMRIFIGSIRRRDGRSGRRRSDFALLSKGGEMLIDKLFGTVSCAQDRLAYYGMDSSQLLGCTYDLL